MTSANPQQAAELRERAAQLTAEEKFDDAIETYAEAIRVAPGDLETHEAMREAGLRRKAQGKRAGGLIARWKALLAKDDAAALAAWSKLLAYDPGNTDLMLKVLDVAKRMNLPRVMNWMEIIYMRIMR